jgi:hypothetical protein
MGQHLQAIYDTRVAEGMLRSRPVQRAALLRLEADAGEAGEARCARGSFRGSGKARAAQQGLYLWGGVGRGKSMLMDLFVDTLSAWPCGACISTPSCRRSTTRCTRPADGVDDAIAPVAKHRGRAAAAGLRRDADHRHHRRDDRGPAVRGAFRRRCGGGDHVEPGAGRPVQGRPEPAAVPALHRAD